MSYVRIRWMLWMVILMAVPGVACAQGLLYAASSRMTEFPLHHGKEVIVREWKTGAPLVHVRDSVYHYRHYFMLRKAIDEQYVGFSFDFYLDDVGLTSLYVNDVQVYGDSCYFCGEAVIDQGAPVIIEPGVILVPQFISVGVVGRMAMADTVGGAWKVEYMLIFEVERLLQLTVFHPEVQQPEFRLLLAATAEQTNDSKPSYLVEVKENMDYTWQYSVLQTDMDGEVFTDVIARGNDLFVSSHVDCGDNDPDNVEHWYHYIHQSSFIGFRDRYYDNYLGSFTEVAMRADNRWMTPSLNGWGWHKSDTPMRMCLMNDGLFCLSYVVENQSTGGGGVVFIPMYDGTAVNTPLLFYNNYWADVCDIAYSPLSNTMAVVLYGYIYPSGFVMISKWADAGFAGVGYLYDRKMESICPYGGRSVLIGGNYLVGNKVMLMQQQSRAIIYVDGDACFSEKKPFTETELNVPKLEKNPVKWNCKVYDKTKDWRAFLGTVAPVQKEMPCFYPWREYLEEDWD